jgi:hypothetical protein
MRANLQQGGALMAIDARIRELGNRHRSLEAAIQEELSRPAVDSLRLTELKRRKLKLKEELEQLRTATH